jgi:hypothetical protein
VRSADFSSFITRIFFFFLFSKNLEHATIQPASFKWGNSASQQMFDMILLRQMENIRSMRNDGSKKGSVEERRERRVGCLATDSALK